MSSGQAIKANLGRGISGHRARNKSISIARLKNVGQIFIFFCVWEVISDEQINMHHFN